MSYAAGRGSRRHNQRPMTKNARKDAGREVAFRDLHLSVRYNTLHFPVDPGELARLVPHAGYVVTQEDILSAPPGARIAFSGRLAKKGDTELRMNTERGVLTIRGNDADSVHGEFAWLENLLRQEFAFDSVAAASFYELVSEIMVESSKDPMMVMARHSQGVSVLGRASEILGFPVSNYTLRMFRTGQNPNDLNWAEIRIEPYVPAASSRFLVSVVFRNEHQETVTEFLTGLEQTVIELIEGLEQW